MWGEVQGPGGRRGCGARRQRKRHARDGEGLTKVGVQGTRGAHAEHVVHVRDAGRVEAHRLVERRRALPSPKEGVRCGGEVWAWRWEGIGAATALGACRGRGSTAGRSARRTCRSWLRRWRCRSSAAG
eukprot:scaffold2947_cov67-Phaeocystis_antarctica.AAC.6